MPIAEIQGPPVADIETKRTLVAEITDTLEKAYKLPRNLFVVIIKAPPRKRGLGRRIDS